MYHEETAKLKLGRACLNKIEYRQDLSNEEFISAVNRQGMSAEEKAAIIFALKHCGEQAMAEADALIAEGEALEVIRFTARGKGEEMIAEADALDELYAVATNPQQTK